jgi:hypothetical protein
LEPVYKKQSPVAGESDPMTDANSNWDFPIAKFMRFLKLIRLRKLLKNITDKRDPCKIRYKLDFILHWALSVFFFRTESLNKLQHAFDRIPLLRKKTLWNFFDLPEGSALPHRQTVTENLALVNPDEINDILIQLFKWALKQKIFYNHQQFLTAEFYFACDGVKVHHYTKPHCTNESDGKNDCPYCLSRTRNKGTPDETTYWLHVFVNVAVILPGGVQLPLYVHALKAQQLLELETVSDEKYKQECELQAAKEIIPLLHERFPRLPVTFLSDSLYANEPVLKLLKDCGWEFMIVRQEGSLKKLAEHCDVLEGSEIYKGYRAKETISLKNGGKSVRSIKWFNGERAGDQEVHVIRFVEEEYNSEGVLIKYFKTEWLSSKRVNKNNCFKLVQKARRRADHEDLHNTCKNRGFHAEHDYARKDPNASLIWKLLLFVAFWIFELFSCTKLAQTGRGSDSWKNFSRELLVDIQREHWELVRCSPSLAKERLQFRFNFSGH